MHLNENFYKVLDKTGTSRVLYSVMQSRLKKQNINLFTLKSIAIEEIRKDTKDSSIIKRDPSWLDFEYDLDIIIPVFNSRYLLEACICSAIAQVTDYNFKIIIINDGSTDAITCDILEKYASHDNVIIVNKKNGGVSSARNQGLLDSKGRYVMFLDSDDILYPDSVDKLLKTAYFHDADIVEGAYKYISETQDVIDTAKHLSGRITSYNDMFGFPWGKVFKRELFYNLKYPNYYYEDSIIKTIIYPKANSIYGISDFVYGYTRNENGLTFSSRMNEKSLDSFWITKSIDIDRKNLGIEDNQEYYEYLLRIIRLTYRRNIYLDKAHHVDLFKKWCELLSAYNGYTTNSKFYDLELAIRTRNFRLYSVWCRLNMFL